MSDMKIQFLRVLGGSNERCADPMHVVSVDE